MDAVVETPSSSLRVARARYGNKMWLMARDDVPTAWGPIALQGYIPETCLGAHANWQKVKPAQREALDSAMREQHLARLDGAWRRAATALETFASICVADRLEPKLSKLRDQWASGKVNLAELGAALEQSLTSLRANKRHRELAEQIGRTVRLADYPDTFPARRRARKLIAVLGVTNSGKTYDAFQRLATAESGVYLGPLRLLALEAYTRLNEEFGVVASLITGEERRLTEGASVTASTIEMLDTSVPVEVAVIDEIQMLNDPDRGWAWTQAVVGANASELWLLGALSAEPAIRALAARLGLPLEVRYKERKHPLAVGCALGNKPGQALHQARTGDAFIVFSRRDALNLRDDLLAMGRTVACIYGALSPEVREREASRFAQGEADILVATDAIGMGLNLPIQRVVFTSAQKFDGVVRGDLPVPLLQQIAGRAGRYGHQEEAGIVAGLTPAEHQAVTEGMRAKQAPLPSRGFQITAGTEYLEQIAAAAQDDRLEALLSLFQLHADCGDGFFAPYIPEEQLLRAAELDRLAGMPLATKHLFSMAPMSSQDEAMNFQWQNWASAAHQGRQVRLDFLPKSPIHATLGEAETMVRLLAAYRWFGYRMPELFVEHQLAEEQLAPWIGAVDAHLRSQRRQGVGGGRAGVPSWYWPYRS